MKTQNSPPMRLSPEHIQTIQATVHDVLGSDARVWLFGSRLDDSRKGGDVDLLIQAQPEPGLLQRASIKNQLEDRLQLPVDITTAAPERASAFARLAMAQAVALN